LTRIECSSVKVGTSRVIGQEKKIKKPDINPEVMMTLQKAKVEAEQLIVTAQAQVDKYMLEAQQQTETESSELYQKSKFQGYEDGYSEGKKQGYDEGYNRILSEMSEKIQALETLVKSSFEVKNQIVRSSEKEILEFVVLIAEKMVRTKLEMEPELVSNIIKSAISELKEKDEVKIVINPALAEKIYAITDEIKKGMGGVNNIKIIEDRTVSPDGVIVESVDTRIDARLDTQVAQITKALMAEYAINPVITNDLVSLDNMAFIKSEPEEFCYIENPEIIEAGNSCTYKTSAVIARQEIPCGSGSANSFPAPMGDTFF